MKRIDNKMKFLASGKCLWDFEISGKGIILDDNMNLPIEKCIGKIIIVHSPSPDVILYMRYAVAVIAETGGTLCHAAVLAMELGCPIVVTVENVTNILHDEIDLFVIGRNGVGSIYEANV